MHRRWLTAEKETTMRGWLWKVIPSAAQLTVIALRKMDRRAYVHADLMSSNGVNLSGVQWCSIISGFSAKLMEVK